MDDSWDGFELLINDVLRLKANASTHSYTFERNDTSVPYFARLAYANGDEAGDFTKAATVFINNDTMVPPEPGPS